VPGHDQCRRVIERRQISANRQIEDRNGSGKPRHPIEHDLAFPAASERAESRKAETRDGGVHGRQRLSHGRRMGTTPTGVEDVARRHTYLARLELVRR
jgi:hypothetical protein